MLPSTPPPISLPTWFLRFFVVYIFTICQTIFGILNFVVGLQKKKISIYFSPSVASVVDLWSNGLVKTLRGRWSLGASVLPSYCQQWLAITGRLPYVQMSTLLELAGLSFMLCPYAIFMDIFNKLFALSGSLVLQSAEEEEDILKKNNKLNLTQSHGI